MRRSLWSSWVFSPSCLWGIAGLSCYLQGRSPKTSSSWVRSFKGSALEETSRDLGRNWVWVQTAIHQLYDLGFSESVVLWRLSSFPYLPSIQLFCHFTSLVSFIIAITSSRSSFYFLLGCLFICLTVNPWHQILSFMRLGTSSASSAFSSVNEGHST